MQEGKVIHKGWDWEKAGSEVWNEVSAEFLPIAVDWAGRFGTMLDIGAGKGRNSFYMNKLGLEVSAVDISESSIDIINKRNAELGCTVAAQTADMTALPFEDGSFDCVVCFHAIYHTDREGLIKALSEIRRVLKSGGEAFITFNSKDSPSFRRGRQVDEFTIYKTEGLEKDIPHTYVDFGDLPRLMDGFALIRVQQIIDYIRRERPTGGNHFFVLARKMP